MRFALISAIVGGMLALMPITGLSATLLADSVNRDINRYHEQSLYLYIPASKLSRALNQLSYRFNIPVVAHLTTEQDVTTDKLEGEYTLLEAVRLLLGPNPPSNTSTKTSSSRNTSVDFSLTAQGLLVKPADNNLTQAVDNTASLEEIVVQAQKLSPLAKSFRDTLISGQELKREAIGSQDFIVAEYLADFPDLNLAEALQRIPGISVNRDGGEGRRIALRGLDAYFSLVQLNGMEVLANTDSALDSRSQGRRERLFDFNIFASELFNQIAVKKSYSASDDEGGLAGNVALRTAKPFDHQGFNSALSVQAGKNSYSDDIAPRMAFLVSNTWQHLGALASISYSKRDIEEKGANTYRWRKQRDTDGLDNSRGSLQGENISDADFDAITLGEVIVPRGNRYSVWQNTQTRLGVTTSLQYKTDQVELVADLLYGELLNDRSEYHLNPRNNADSMVYGDGVVINRAHINAQNELVYGDFSNTVINAEARAHDVETVFSQLVLSANWQFDSQLSLQALLGTQQSELYTNSVKVYTETRGDVVIDYRQDPWFGHYQYQQDMSQTSNWWLQEVDVRTDREDTVNHTIKVSADYLFTELDSLKLGVSAKKVANARVRANAEDLLRDDNDNGHALFPRLPAELFIHVDSLPQQSWAVVAPKRVLSGVDKHLLQALSDAQGSSFNGRLAITIDDAVNQMQETTTNAYIEYLWQRQINNIGFKGSVGLRYYHTETSADIAIAAEHVQAFNHDYQGWLPSVNLVIEPVADILLRFSYHHNITRPSYQQLTTGALVEEQGADIDVRMGNPSLRPYQSQNIDVSLEWYQGDLGYLVLSYYQKNVSDYIMSKALG